MLCFNDYLFLGQTLISIFYYDAFNWKVKPNLSAVANFLGIQSQSMSRLSQNGLKACHACHVTGLGFGNVTKMLIIVENILNGFA